MLSFAAGLASAQPSKPFLLRADSAAPYQRGDLVFDAMKRLQVDRIFLLTAQDPAQKDGSEWPSVLLGGIWLPLPPWEGASD